MKIANRGFACCGEEVRFFLHLQAGGGDTRIIPVDCEIGKLAAGRSLTLCIPLEEGMAGSGTSLYGELRRVRDHKTIMFANEPVEDRLSLGVFR